MKRRTFGALVDAAAEVLRSDRTTLLDAFSDRSGYERKTVLEWEPKDFLELSHSSRKSIRSFFVERLYRRVGQVFSRLHHMMIPSEVTGVWFAVDKKLVCFYNSQWFALGYAEHHTWDVHLSGPGLTTFAVHVGSTVRLSGEQIPSHPSKRFRGHAVNSFLAGNLSKSIMRTPVFEDGRPLLLLAAENKLIPARSIEKLGPEEARLRLLQDAYDAVIEREIPLAQKLEAVEASCDIVRACRFEPADVMSCDGKVEVYSANDEALSIRVSRIAQRVLTELNEFLPAEDAPKRSPSIYDPRVELDHLYVTPYRSVIPTPRDLVDSPLHRARDPRKAESHARLSDSQERIAHELNLAALPGKPADEAIREILLSHHRGSTDTASAIESIAKAGNMDPCVVRGMLEQFACYGHMELHLTDICNLNCLGCTYANEREGAVLPFEAIANLSRLYPESVVVVGGGEPTLYRQGNHRFRDAIMQLKEVGEGLQIGLITNGVILPESLTEWAQQIRWLRISIDAATPNTFEEFRGKDVHAQVLSNFLEYLRETRIAQVGTSFLYSKQNVGEYADFVFKIFETVRAECPQELHRVNIQFRPLRSPDPVDNASYAVNEAQIDEQLTKLAKQCDSDPELAQFVRRQTNAYALLGGNVHPLLRFSACRYSSIAGIARASGEIITCFCKVGHKDFVVGDLRNLEVASLGLRKLLMRTLLSSAECNPETCRMSFVNYILEQSWTSNAPAMPMDLLIEKGV